MRPIEGWTATSPYPNIHLKGTTRLDVGKAHEWNATISVKPHDGTFSLSVRADTRTTAHDVAQRLERLITARTETAHAATVDVRDTDPDARTE